MHHPHPCRHTYPPSLSTHTEPPFILQPPKFAYGLVWAPPSGLLFLSSALDHRQVMPGCGTAAPAGRARLPVVFFCLDVLCRSPCLHVVLGAFPKLENTHLSIWVSVSKCYCLVQLAIFSYQPHNSLTHGVETSLQASFHFQSHKLALSEIIFKIVFLTTVNILF